MTTSTLRTRSTTIRDTRQIRLLASGARQEIVDALEVAGPCSVRELASHLGRRPDALYYHIKLLRKAKLVVADDEAVLPGARAEVVLDVAYRPMSLEYEPANAGNRTAVGAVVSTMLRSAQRRFIRAFLPGIATVTGDTRNLWAGRAQGWLCVQDVRTINQHVAAILDILRRRRKAPPSQASRGTPDRDQLLEFTFLLAPRRTRTPKRGVAQ